MHEPLKQAIRELRSLAVEVDDGRVAKDLESAERRLSETTFRLLVVGEYKRGKSTLINALLGHEVVPTGVVPLTSILTEIHYAPWQTARICFSHGREEEVPAGELAGFITEPGNPRNQKGVQRAIVGHPAPLLRDGVTILDTPGIASIFEHNSQLTFESLHEADAVVIVLAADQPLTAEEHRLLERLRDITDHVLIVLNRMDVLAAEDRATSLGFVRQTMASLHVGNPEFVFPLAARPALDAQASGLAPPPEFVAFESALRRVLVDRKADLLAARARTIALHCSEHLALRLTAEERAMQFSKAELSGTIENFRQASTGLNRQIDEAGVLLRHTLEQAQTVELAALAHEADARIRSSVWPDVEAALDARQSEPVRRVFHDVADEIGTRVVSELAGYYLDSEVLMRTSLGRAVDEYSARLRVAAGEVTSLASRTLGVPAQVPHAIVVLDELPRFYYRAWGGTGGHLLTHEWWMLLPRTWAERRARRELDQILKLRIRQNLGAIRSDWSMRIEDALRRFDATSQEQGRRLFATIEQALRSALDGQSSSDSARAERVADIVRARARVEAIQRDLAGCTHAKNA